MESIAYDQGERFEIRHVHLSPREVAAVGLGTTTTSALSQGVVAMTLGAVSELYQRVFSRDPTDRGLRHCLVTITGGMRQSLAPILRGAWWIRILFYAGVAIWCWAVAKNKA